MLKRPSLSGLAGLLSHASPRRLASRAARRLGYYVTRDPAPILQAEHLRRLFTALRIDCVLDIGAHRGDFGAWLRTIGYAGLIISFEPVSENYEILRERTERDKRWHAHRIALGARAGIAEMQIFEGNTFHSFLESSAFGRDRFADRMELTRRESVRVERLDTMLPELLRDVAEPHVFMKVDTQGFDLEVIRGLGAEIRHVSAIQMEIAVKPIYECATNGFVDAWTELDQLGFQVSAMFPVTYDADGISLVEFDCVMCRRADADAAS
jgi:FkbM family methyltransferase